MNDLRRMVFALCMVLGAPAAVVGAQRAQDDDFLRASFAMLVAVVAYFIAFEVVRR